MGESDTDVSDVEKLESITLQWLTSFLCFLDLIGSEDGWHLVCH